MSKWKRAGGAFSRSDTPRIGSWRRGLCPDAQRPSPRGGGASTKSWKHCFQDIFICVRRTQHHLRACTQHHLSFSSTSLSACGHKWTRLHFAQTDFPPRVLKNTENCAIISSERRCYNEKSISFFAFNCLNSYACFLSSELVWQSLWCSMVFYSRSRSCPVCRFVCDYDIQNIRVPEM